MRYNYTCTGAPRCKVKDVPAELQEKLMICIGDLDNRPAGIASQAEWIIEIEKGRPPINTDPKEAFLVWEEEHGMFANVEIKCPVCKSLATKSYSNYYFVGYVKGNGYLDKAGAHRDMNLWKLEKDDPYASMRVPGEVDDLKQKLRNAGKRNYNTKRHYT